MTENFVHGPLPSVVPPHFNRLPYCSPDHHNGAALDILVGYDLELHASGPDFLDNLSATYDADKPKDCEAPSKAKSKEPTLDLRDPEQLEGMASHTLLHSVSGLLDAGVSKTTCIPYWDREAVSVGLDYQDSEHARERLEIIDVLSINALRSYCHYLGPKPLDHKHRLGLLDHAIAMGKRSRENIQPLQEFRRASIQQEHDMLINIYAAKLKHLVWLVDQQLNPQIRFFMQPEVCQYIEHATARLGLPAERLTVDMGRDTGISSDSSRPPYDISMFVQLRHLFIPGQEEQTYSRAQGKCQRLNISDLQASIARKDDRPPSYYKPERYRLPFLFED